MNEAFVDFTGGVGEVLYLRQDTPGLFSALRHALAKESLVGATALVRESDSHGDPSPSTRTKCTVTARGGGVRVLLSFTTGLFSLTNQTFSELTSFRHSGNQVLSRCCEGVFLCLVLG